MKRWIPFAIVMAVALAGVVGGVILYKSHRPELASSAVATVSSGVLEHSKGPSDAAITLEEFGDFQCPPCGQLSEPLNQIERDYRNKVRLVFRQLPLPNHIFGRAAAAAAEAAGLQGKFWEMHDVLYREQSLWSKADNVRPIFESYARIVNLDVTRFQRDLDSAEVKTRIAADEQRAADLSISVTPTILLNGKRVAGKSLNPAGLRAEIEAILSAPKSK